MRTFKIFTAKKNPAFFFMQGILGLTFVGAILCCSVLVSAEEGISSQENIRLNLKEAIDLALKNNIMLKLAHENLQKRQGLRMQSRSKLMPHVFMNASQERVFWHNLVAEGYTEADILGPFNSFDAQVQIFQRVFDLSALSGFRAEEKALQIARLQEGLAKERVLLSAVFSYLNVLGSEEKLRAVEEDIKLSQQLIVMAEHQFSAGVVTELDVVRAQARRAQQQAHRQDILQSLHKDYFQLMRVTGLPLKRNVQLIDSLEFFHENILSLEEALTTAFHDRVEMKLSQEKIQYQKEKISQAQKERFPQIDVFGKYGQSGATPKEDAHEVGSIGVKVSVPIWGGGKTKGQVLEARSHKRTEEIKRDDIQIQIEEDVRLSLQTLTTSTDRVQAAEEAFNLAKREVELAQNQYHAGMENNIAVGEAQTALARAHELYIISVMQYDFARVNYFSALGQTQSFYLNPLKDEGENNGS